MVQHYEARGYGYVPTKSSTKSDEVKQVTQELCACVVDKLEQKHTPNQLNDLKEDELDRMGMLCLSGGSLVTHILYCPKVNGN